MYRRDLWMGREALRLKRVSPGERPAAGEAVLDRGTCGVCGGPTLEGRPVCVECRVRERRGRLRQRP